MSDAAFRTKGCVCDERDLVIGHIVLCNPATATEHQQISESDAELKPARADWKWFDDKRGRIPPG